MIIVVRKSNDSKTSFRTYRVEHENIKFISTSERVIFCLLCKHTNDGFFDDFPKISEHFPKISEDSRKVVRRPDNRFRTFSENLRRLPKIAEDFRGRTDDVRFHRSPLLGACNSHNKPLQRHYRPVYF